MHRGPHSALLDNFVVMSCCSQLDGLEVRSVGNSQVLKETALIEAFNLKAAIEMVLKNNAAVAEALADMPPRCIPGGQCNKVACMHEGLSASLVTTRLPLG